ncbi:MAG TPA: hypothetical protein VMU06_01345 [Stellaceae bacterium]|nr:hypothetical protein [Stellaceae bacterium]
MSKPELIPVMALPYLYGLNRATAHRMASAGKLGPLVRPQGLRRHRMAHTAELERRFGPLSEERIANAIAEHRGSLRLVRQFPPVPFVAIEARHEVAL